MFPSGYVGAFGVCSFVTTALRPRWVVSSVRSAKGQVPYNAWVRGKNAFDSGHLTLGREPPGKIKKCAVICQSRVLTYNFNLLQHHWFSFPLMSPCILKARFKGSLLLSSIRLVMPLAKIDKSCHGYLCLRINRAFARCCQWDLDNQEQSEKNMTEKFKTSFSLSSAEDLCMGERAVMGKLSLKRWWWARNAR